METDQARTTLLTVNYKSDAYYHCSCACGTNILLTEDQLKSMDSCGCLGRKTLLAAVGMSEDDYDFSSTLQPTKDTENKDRGIGFDSKKGKWRARITYQSKEYHLGYFPDKDAAVAIRAEAEANISGNFLEWFANLQAKR